MLRPGETAPAFSARATNGTQVSLTGLRGQTLVLYFFPKAFTPGCTVETRGFRDNYYNLREHGAEVIGISTDDLETQCRFAERHGVSFPMVADKGREITRAYKVSWPLLRIAKRVTYIVDGDGIIRAAFHHEFQVHRHLDDVLKFVARSRGA
jgi:peroxiredoxin